MHDQNLSKTCVEAFCPRCRSRRQFSQRQPHLGWNLLLTIATCGLWGPVWFFQALFAEMRPWRCIGCNWHKPVFIGEEMTTIWKDENQL